MTYLIFNDGKSHKFWQIVLSGTDLKITWGKIGTDGRTQVKSFDSQFDAKSAMDKLINEKLKKGYQSNIQPENIPNQTAATEINRVRPQSSISVPESSIEPSSDLSSASQSPIVSFETESIKLPKHIAQKAFSTRTRPWDSPVFDLEKSWLHVHKVLSSSNLSLQAMLPENIEVPDDFINAIIETHNRIQQNDFEGSSLSDAILLCAYLECCDVRPALDDYFDVTEFLMSKNGLSVAIDVLLMSFQIAIIWQDQHRVLTMTQSGPNTTASDYKSCLYHFREYLSCADNDTWLDCASKLIKSLDCLHIGRHAFIAFLIPERIDIISRVGLSLLEAEQNELLDWHTYEWAMNLLKLTTPLQIIEPPHLQTALTEIYIRANRFPEKIFDKFAAALAIDRGLSLEKSIIKTFGWACNTSKTILTLMPLPAAMKSLSHHIESKAGLSFFQKSVNNWPLVAIPVLAKLSSSQPNEYVFEYLLKKLILENQSKIESSVLSDDDAADRIILSYRDKLTAKLSEDQYARTSDLPTLLVTPPWMDSQTNIQFVDPVMTLAPIPSVPENHFTELEIKKANNFSLGLFKNEQITDDTMQYLIPWLGFSLSHNDELYTSLAVALKSFDGEKLLEIYESYSQKQKLSINFTLTRLLPDEIAVSIWNQYSQFGYEGTDYMLTRHGTNALPGLVRLLDTSPAKNIAYASKLVSSECALPIAKMFNSNKPIRQKAAKWLLDFQEHAITALIPAALGPKGKVRENAKTALVYIANEGSKELVLQIAKQYDPTTVYKNISALINGVQGTNTTKAPPKLPDFWHSHLFSRLRLKSNNKLLPDFAMATLILMLSQSNLEVTYDGVESVLEAVTDDSFSQLTWELFVAWNNLSGEMTESWMFTALALNPTDKIVDDLTSYIVKWPSESLTQRALFGLEILGKIGSDRALQNLNEIAAKGKLKSLKLAAKSKVEQIAKNRNLSYASLEDKLIPYLGLTTMGEKILEIGTLKIRLKIDDTLHLNLFDLEGNPLKQLPKVEVKWDDYPAKLAIELVKTLPKDIRKIITTQTKRFEQAMYQRRRWSFEAFTALFIEHPLITHLGQKLFFGIYQESSNAASSPELIQIIRINEDRSLSNELDARIELTQFDQSVIGLIHPIDLTPTQLDALKLILADYEIIQPFEQIQRPYFRFEQSGGASDYLQGFIKQAVSTKRLIALLNFGFVKLNAGQEFKMLGKEITSEVSLRIVFDPGFIIIMPDDEPIQTVTKIDLVETATLDCHSNPLVFDEIDPLAISELLMAINTLIEP